MPNYFPRQTIQLRFEEPKAIRRLSFSLLEMAIITGVVLRTFRLFVLTHGSNNWIYLGGTFAIGLAFLAGMTTAYLGNFPLHHYPWRAPAFALVEVAAEMGTSALFMALHRERNGSVSAHWDDWVGMAFDTLWTRGLAIVLWGLVLAAVVSIVRRTIVHEDEEPAESVAH